MTKRLIMFISVIARTLHSKVSIGRDFAICHLLLALALNTQAQTSVDSLRALLNNRTADTTHVGLLNQLGHVYTYSATDSALTYTRRALSLAHKIGYHRGTARANYQLSRINRLLGNYPEALNNGLESLTYYEQAKQKPQIAGVLTNLGSIYFRLQDYDKALEYYQESMKMHEELGDETGLASSLVGIGLVYENIFQYEKALTNYLQALAINRHHNLLLNTATNLVNIGDLYLNQNQYEKALPFLIESLEINKKINNQQGMASVFRHLAQLYQKKGDLQKSMEYAELALELANRVKRKVIASEVSLLLSENYTEFGDYQKAFEFFQLHIKYKDSLYNVAKLKELSSLESRYEVQQREQELKIQEQTIALLNRDNKLDRLWRNILAGGLLLFGLLGFIVYKFLRLRNRKSKELLAIEQTVTQKLQQLDKEKSQFFANISHEFRTPLTLIKGPIEQLDQNTAHKLGPESLGMIKRNTDRLLRLVDQLLDLSKLDEGNLKLETKEAEVFGFLRATASSFDSHANERNISYKIQVPTQILWASFDQDKLEKIIYNLLGNAFKFSNTGSEINLTVTHANHILRIRIEDNGPGIAPKQLPKIFNRFYRADDKGGAEGSGIGLALTHELVELMGGSINVQSKLGKGTAFTIKIPLQVIPEKMGATSTTTGASKEQRSSFSIKSSGERTEELPIILLIEDNKDMRSYITEVLSHSFRIQEAKNGRIGLEIAVVNPPDLIISDLMMPEMDGMQFCKHIKSHIVTSHIPVIMLTAKSGLKNKIEGLELGADDYITKPFEAKELLARAKNLIKQRKQLRESYSQLKTQLHPKGITINSLDEDFLEKLHELLESNYMNPEFKVPHLYKAMAMSRAQFQRKIKALCNETPGALLRNFRLKRAAQLLTQDANNIGQIAYDVGFNNLSYFTKCFREYFDTLPSSYPSEYPVH